jgi:hypothetical protein
MIMGAFAGRRIPSVPVFGTSKLGASAQGRPSCSVRACQGSSPAASDFGYLETAPPRATVRRGQAGTLSSVGSVRQPTEKIQVRWPAL